MKQYRIETVEIALPDGTVIDAEVHVPTGGDVALRDCFELGEMRKSLASISTFVFEAVRDGLPRRPERIAVDFGVKLAVKSGKITSILAEASGEASVTVRLEWGPDAR